MSDVGRRTRRGVPASPTLAQGLERARRIVETARDAFISISAFGVVEEWNQAAELLFGWSAKEAIGRPLDALIIPTAQRSWHRQGLARMMAGGDAHILEQTVELIAIRRDHSEVPVELTVWSVEGDRRSFSAFVRDISERRAQEIIAARLGSVVEFSSDAILSLDPSGVVLSWNAGAEKIYGYTAREMVGKNADSMLAPPVQDSDSEVVRDLLVDNAATHREVSLIRANGQPVTVSVTNSPILDADGELMAVSSISRDITHAKEIERALQASEERFRLTQLHAPTGLALVGLDGRYLQVNPALCELVGRSEEELMSLTFKDITHPEDLPKDLDLLEQLEHAEIQGYELEKRYLRPDGSIVWALLSRSIVRGSEPHFVTHVHDISSRKLSEVALAAAAAELEDLNRRLSIQSVTDPLTGAFNRRHLDATLASTCRDARRHGDHTALLLLDVDHFKSVNDRFGHHRGDDVLRAIAERLTSTLRDIDTLGRWGGEEFVILLPRTDQKGAEAIAERTRAVIADELIGDREEALRVTVSIGAVAALDSDPDRLLGRADQALYRAKAAGRNQVAAG